MQKMKHALLAVGLTAMVYGFTAAWKRAYDLEHKMPRYIMVVFAAGFTAAVASVIL